MHINAFSLRPFKSLCFQSYAKEESVWSAGKKIHNERKNVVFFMFLHLSSFCAIFAYATSSGFLKTSSTVLDFFPSVLCNICQCVQHLRFLPLGNTASPYVDKSLSLQCLLFLVTFLFFHSLPHFLAATSVHVALYFLFFPFFSPISISIRKWPCKNGLLA